MAEAETDFYSTLGQGQKPFNALEMVGNFAQAQNALNQNKLFQLETGARQAIGEIMKNSMTPEGAIDYDKAAIALSTDPRSAFKAPEIINQWINQQNVKAETYNKTLENKIKQMGAYGDAAQGLLQYGDDELLGKTINKVGELVGMGMLDKDSAMAQITSMTQAAKESPKSLRQYLQGVALQSMGAKEAAEKVYGTVNNIDSGGVTNITATSPMFGTVRSLGTVEKTPTAENMNTLVDVVDPVTKRTIKVPRFQVNKMIGGAGSPANLLTGADGNGSLPGAGAQGAAGEGDSEPAAPPNLAALAPGEEKYLEQAGSKIAEMEENLNKVVESGTGIVQNIGQAREALKNFKPGGGAETFMELSRVAQAFGLNKLADDLAGGSRAAAQTFQKSIMGVVLPQLKTVMQGLGQMNLAEFESILKANPNIETDPRAMETLIGFVERQVMIAQAKQQGFSRWKTDNRDPLQFEAAWQKALQNKHISKPKKQ